MPAREQVFEHGPTEINAAGIVLAVPAWDAGALVPDGLAGEAAPWSGLEPSPIVSLHVIYGSRVTQLPFAAAVGAAAALGRRQDRGCGTALGPVPRRIGARG